MIDTRIIKATETTETEVKAAAKQRIIGALGATNHSRTGERATDDFYATDPGMLQVLLDNPIFKGLNMEGPIWEPCCGDGALSRVLEREGYDVKSTDLVDRGYGQGEMDFLKYEGTFDGNIITNPPYGSAEKFVQHALDVVTPGHLVVMLLKDRFLEGQNRFKNLHKKTPHSWQFSFTGRGKCYKDGKPAPGSGTIAFMWYVWVKGGNVDAPRQAWLDYSSPSKLSEKTVAKRDEVA